MCQGNVRGKQNFLKVGGKSENFGHLTHVREFCNVVSMNFGMALFLD